MSVTTPKGIIFYSNYSLPKLIYTKKRDIDSLLVNLYIKGTGKNNHDNAEVRLGNKVIFKSGTFQGLGLIVINRDNLKVEFVNTYNTFIKGPKKFITVPVIDYVYNTDQSVSSVTIERQILIENEYENSNNLYEKLITLDEKSFVIIVSCYGWEKYVSNELVDLLGTFGAINIREFKNINEEEYKSPLYSSWNNQEIIKYRPYYHPYAFIGVRYMQSGLGYESLRTNKGNFLTTENVPFAEILVRLKWYKYHNNYYFDDDILGKERLTYSDSYNMVWNATDYSLENMLGLLHYFNMTLGYNLGFSIYNFNIDQDVIYKKTIDELIIPYQTAYDKVTLGVNVAADRYTFKGIRYQEGINIRSTNYFEFLRAVFYNERVCTYPYVYSLDKPECPNTAIFNTTIPILKCKIGLAPHVCDFNIDNFTDIFTGYD